MWSFDDIKTDLIRLGIKKRDTLFLRISYRAIGKINGGPKVFLDALIDVIGEEGTIILTAFPKLYMRQFRWFHKNKIFSKDNPPKPLTGVMSVIAQSYPNAMMSENLTHPFIVIGKHSEYLTRNYDYSKESYWVINEAIKKFNCKCLRVGGEEFTGTTHLAFTAILKEKGYYQRGLVEGLYVLEKGKLIWREIENTIFCSKAFFENMQPMVKEFSVINEGSIGAAIAVLTDMKKSLAKEIELLRENIMYIVCNDKDCMTCRFQNDFSSNKYMFIKTQILNILHGQFKIGVKNLIKTIKIFISSRKMQ